MLINVIMCCYLEIILKYYIFLDSKGGLLMQKKAILCVDDEKIILDSLKSQIKRRFGNLYKCEIASSATEAIEVIDELIEAEVEILIIVSDWLMPGIKGDEFLISIHEKFPKIIKLMITGQADSEAIENARIHANLFACISKPWKEEELFEILESALEEIKI
jgi:DNA-binding NtrC family response regulator